MLYMLYQNRSNTLKLSTYEIWRITIFSYTYRCNAVYFLDASHWLIRTCQVAFITSIRKWGCIGLWYRKYFLQYDTQVTKEHYNCSRIITWHNFYFHTFGIYQSLSSSTQEHGCSGCCKNQIEIAHFQWRDINEFLRFNFKE